MRIRLRSPSPRTLLLCLVVICFGLFSPCVRPNCSNPKAKAFHKKIIVEECQASSQLQPQEVLDLSRWDKNFDDIFYVPDPISSRVGPENRANPHKYIIYRCDMETLSYCGGWADRVRGMFTAYILANLTGRVFKSEIIMSRCNVLKFMVPNAINWNLAMSFHKKVKPGPRVKIWDMWGNLTLYDKHFRSMDFVHHPAMDSDYLYIKANHDNMDSFRESEFHGKTLEWMQGLDRVTINRFLFKHLFKPSQYLRAKVTKFLAQYVTPTDKLICAHMRMGRNPTIPMETRESISMKYLPRVWKFLQEQVGSQNDSVKIFIMSDSQRVIQESQCQSFKDKLFFTPGEIIHIELTRGVTDQQKCDGLEKVIFEQLILLHCDVLMVSDSGLSRMSAYIRGRNKNLYCFLKEGYVIPCDMIDIKPYFHTRG